MHEQPLVTVIIASYNMAQYLPQAVESVLAQTWKNLELVVVDDGSKDNTQEVMSGYGDDPRVRFFHSENKGQPKAKNRGLAEAKGDFIAWCDADDIWSPNKLQVQMCAFSDPKVGVVYSEVGYMDSKSTPINKEIPYKRHSGNVTEHLVINNFVPFGTAVFRRDCMDNNGKFDENLPMGIDWDLWLRYSIDWTFHYVPEVTYIYRIWPGQMSRNYRGRYDNAFLILRKFISNYPERVSPRLQSKAWADMYVGRAMSLASSENLWIEPFTDILTGLRHDLTYWPAWKSLIKLIIRRF